MNALFLMAGFVVVLLPLLLLLVLVLLVLLLKGSSISQHTRARPPGILPSPPIHTPFPFLPSLRPSPPSSLVIA